MQHFTKRADVPDPAALLRLARACKQEPERFHDALAGKTLALVFLQPSLRTRLSTQKAAQTLGMQVITLDARQGWKLEWREGVVMDGDRAEHIREAAGVISQYADLIAVRAFAGLQDRAEDYAEPLLEAFRRHAGVPVLSLESATRHPLQSLADWLTIEEHKTRPRPKVVLSWAPHPRALPQAVANSFLEWMRAAEVELVLTHPEGYELDPAFTGGLQPEYDQERAFEGADFVYAKNWSALEPYGAVLRTDGEWMVTPEKMARTRSGRFLHCLPVRRNVVVSDAVLDGPRSLVLQQAANREYAAQAALLALLAENPLP
ncbi:MAG: N-acetylornithine carbamoyltransferase [Bacteroidetes bacterium]|nr:MAG: N-acetylornithine carbamoyltransferase [Bacteroidota bacterium]